MSNVSDPTSRAARNLTRRTLREWRWTRSESRIKRILAKFLLTTLVIGAASLGTAGCYTNHCLPTTAGFHWSPCT